MRLRPSTLRRAFAVTATALAAFIADASVSAQHEAHSHTADLGEPMQRLLATTSERTAYDLLREGKLFGARTASEEALRRSEDSIVGHYVLGAVLRDAEGDLGRSMYHLGRSRELFEKMFDIRDRDIPWRFHRDLLFETQLLAGDMEAYEYQLAILDYHANLHYEPELIAGRAWPLMKLGRFDDARAVATKALTSKDQEEQRLGRNALCAIEGEARARRTWFDACLTAYEAAKRDAATATGAPIAVAGYNAALAAYAVVDHGEAERIASEGTRSKTFGIANPWRLLSGQYTDAGRINEAVAAAREMNQWRAHEPVSARDQDHAETDVALAKLMLVFGEVDRGLALVGRAVERPDRRGLTSSTGERTRGAHVLLRHALSRVAAEEWRERSSYSVMSEKPSMRLRAIALDARAAQDEERIRSVLTDERVLDATFRVYLGGGLEGVPTWLLGDLVSILGPGVAAVVIDRARAQDADFSATAPYYDALQAEVALRRDDAPRALALADAAFRALPRAEVLLGARVAALAGEAARKVGDKPQQLLWIERALAADRGVVRRMAVAIPAAVEAVGDDPTAAKAAALLRRSPRFEEDREGFRVTVESRPGELRACLLSPQGSQIACATASGAPGETIEALPGRAVEALHREVFAPALKLTATDLHSLDGSTTVASQAEREGMRETLRDLDQE